MPNVAEPVAKLASFFGKAAKDAKSVARADELERAALAAGRTVGGIDPKRGQEAVSRLEALSTDQIPEGIPMREKLRVFEENSAIKQAKLDEELLDDPMMKDPAIAAFSADEIQAVQLADNVAPLNKALASHDTGRPPFRTSNTVEIAEDIRAGRQMVSDMENGTRFSAETSLEALTGIPAGRIGNYWYDRPAWERILGVAGEGGRLGRYVGAMPINDAALAVAAFGKQSGKVTKAYKGTDPIILTVADEGKGVWKLVDATGPEVMIERSVSSELRSAEVPVIVRSEDGKVIKNSGRILQMEVNGVTRTLLPPASKQLPRVRFASPLDPEWFRQQPKTFEDAQQAVYTLFDAQNQPVFAAINREAYIDGAKNASSTNSVGAGAYDTLFNIQYNPARLKGSTTLIEPRTMDVQGVRTTYPGKAVDLESAGRIAQEERQAEALAKQRTHYKQFKDPVILERMRRYSHDSLYKLSLLGETDPALKDLPIIFYHTDEAWFDARALGSTKHHAQFVLPAEIGIHTGTDIRQAEHFLPTNAAGGEMMDWYAEAELKWKQASRKVRDTAVSNFGLEQRDWDAMMERIWNHGYTLDELSGPLQNSQTLGAAIDGEVARLTAKYGKDFSEPIKELGQQLFWNLNDYQDAIRQTAMTGYVANLKRPLILMDFQQFSPSMVADQMLQMGEFTKYRKDLKKIVDGNWSQQSWKEEIKGANVKGRDVMTGEKRSGYQEFKADHERVIQILEENGYDHILYPNAVENPGMPSVIMWDQSKMKYTWAPLFNRRSGNPNHLVLPGIPATGAALSTEENKK